MVTITATLPQPGFAYVANAGSDSISSFEINASTGALTPVDEFILTDTSNNSSFSSTPQAVSVHPSGSFVYATANNFINSLVFGVMTDAETRADLTPIPDSPVLVGDFADAVAVDPLGRFAYVVTDPQNEEPGSVEGFTIDPGTGVLTPIGDPDDPPVPTEITPQAIAIDPTARFVYVVNRDSNSVSGFTIVPETGALISIGASFPTGLSPQAIAIDPTGRFAYVTNGDPMLGGVSGFTIDAGTGELRDIPGSAFVAEPGLSLGAMATEPSGQFLYVANSGGDPPLLGYTIDPTGALFRLAAFSIVTRGIPQAVTVDPSGRFVYVAYSGGEVGELDAIASYTINANTGALSEVVPPANVPSTGPVSIAISGQNP
jgi:6-phosphogluconolactonase (cycloisomerase 2 family)